MNYSEKPTYPPFIPWRLLGGLLLVNVVLGILFTVGPISMKIFDNIIDIASVVYSLFLALLCFQGSPKLLGKSSLPLVGRRSGRRFIPALLGIGIMCVMLGQLIRVYGTISTQQEPIYPSSFHFVYLAAYPFFICAFLLLPAQNLSLASRLRIFIDSLLIILTVATVYCYYILVPILALTGGKFLEKIVGSLFTAADLILLFCLLLAALRTRESAFKLAVILLGISLLATFAGHVVYLFGLLSNKYDVTIRANASLLFGLTFIAVAARMMSQVLRAGEPLEQGPYVLLEETAVANRWKSFLLGGMVLIFSLLGIFHWTREDVHGNSAEWAVVDIGSTLFLLLLALRQFLAMYEVNRLRKELGVKNIQLEALANSDPLTGVFNHRTLTSKLGNTLKQAQENEGLCSVIFMDIDHFKSLNDRHGHLVGDGVLCQFVELVAAKLPLDDYLGRWGGEEFVAILPGKDLNEALKVAEEIRLAVAQHLFVCENEALHATCSLGIASYPLTTTEQKDLIGLADKAMYVAKQLGRNQVRTANEPAVLGYQPST